jgi:hypothetical protein
LHPTTRQTRRRGAHPHPHPSRTCLAPRTSGISASGSLACVHSSTSTCWKRSADSRASPAPTHVAHTCNAHGSMRTDVTSCYRTMVSSSRHQHAAAPTNTARAGTLLRAAQTLQPGDIGSGKERYLSTLCRIYTSPNSPHQHVLALQLPESAVSEQSVTRHGCRAHPYMHP